MLQTLKISGKLNLAFAVLALCFLASSVSVFFSVKTMERASAAGTASALAAGEADSLLTQVLEQTNALRGYVIKGDPKFLATYNQSKVAFDDALTSMNGRLDDPQQRARVGQLQGAMALWRQNVGDRVVALMADPLGRAEAAELSGVKSLTGIRAMQKQIREAALQAAKVNGARRDAAEKLAELSMIMGGAVGIAVAGLMAWLLSRSITDPVARMTGVMRRLEAGDHAVEPPGAGRGDELGDMARAMVSFRAAAIEKTRLETEAAAAEAAASAERQHNEEVARRAAQELARVVADLGQGLSKLARGDLSFRLTNAFAAQYQQLHDDFNAAMTELQGAMGVIDNNTRAIRAGVGEIAQASEDLARRTERQAATLEETAAALDEITATVRRSSQTAETVRTLMSSSKGDAEQSSAVVRDAVDAMGAIESSSGKIGHIIGVIDEIAFQTNLLALNAGVEAARAGEAGRGFAVVATEVRALAQRSADAAKEIKTLIANSGAEVSTGVRLVRETGEALNRILTQVTEINGLAADVSASAKEQSSALQSVNTAINQIDQVIQQNAAMVEQSTAATHALSREAGELADLVSRFETGGPAREVPAAPVQARPAPSARPQRMLKTAGGRGGVMASATSDGWEEF